MKKITLLLIALNFSIYSFAQIAIKGVVSHDSIPLESASILIKNSTKGVATNEKGEFKLQAKTGDTLSVSYLGFQTKEIIVKKDEHFDIKLAEGSKLDEVIIVAYSHTRKVCCGMSCRVTCMVETYTENTLSLFPNPSSSGIFHLKLLEDYEEVKISVSNLSGQTIQNSTHQKFGDNLNIDLSEFTTGIYIINIIADEKRFKAIKAIRT